MLDEKEKLLEKNSLFNLRKYMKKRTAYEKARSFYFGLSLFLSLLIICVIYFLSDVSNVYRITVTGNDYLKSEDIIAQSGLNYKSKFMLVITKKAEKSIKKNPLIEKVNVKKKEGRLIQIEVKEKTIIGYTMENGLNVLLLDDGEIIGIGKADLYLISSGPLIEGFDEDKRAVLIKELAKCERKVIREISEIHYYPALKYQNVEVIMADGNYIFTSAYGMDILNHYFDMKSSYPDFKHRCYYFEDISGNAYTSACPWEKVEEVML